MQYSLQLEALCNLLQLGKLTGSPEAIPGGLLHRMYAVETTQRKYAVKALNPQIMRRPAAMKDIEGSEWIANIAAQNIPAIPAKRWNDKAIQELDNQFYLLFDFVEGKSLTAHEIDCVHCEKIGAILSQLHRIDFSELGGMNDRTESARNIDWNDYLRRGRENGAPWVDQLAESIDHLYEWRAQANRAANSLASNRVISHRDLDLKNVLWNGDRPTIIDWESAGYKPYAGFD